MPSHELRKQPRQSRSSDTVEVILEAAARILEAGGQEGVSTNLVAEKAGVSIGSLYQYFPNKQSIMAELVRRERRILLADVEAVCEMAGQLTLDAFIRRLVKVGLTHQFSRPRLACELEHIEAALPLDEGARDLTSQIIAKIDRALKQLDPAIADRAAQDIVAIGQGMANTASLAGETDIQSVERRILKAVSGYLPVNSQTGP